MDVRVPNWTNESSESLKEAAQLVLQSNIDFYYLFSNELSALVKNIEAQLKEPLSECGNSAILEDNGKCIGIYCCYPIIEMKMRQESSLKMMMDLPKISGNIFGDLRKFRTQVEEVSEESTYLSRIAVSEYCRGKGFGKILLRDLENRFSLQRGAISLHVNSKNENAKKFYSSLGFEFIGDRSLEFELMIKRL